MAALRRFVGLTQVQFANAVGEDSEVLEVEVRAYRRLIKRKRYRRTCQCTGARRVVTAAAPPRLIPKGILGISIWVMVLIDKYRLYRPTYRLLEALRIHGLDLALGTVTDGLKRLAPLFAPLREALRARSRTADHWHADETSWYVFEATGEDAGYRWCLWVFWCREAVVFKLDQTRSARVPKEHFAGVAGGTSLRNHWSGLILFVAHPAIPMDNNQAERALRGPVVGRKNYYGSGALWSGELTATLFSLFHTLELWQINPHTWLTEYLSACAAAGSRVPADFERFLPWNRIEGQSPRASPQAPLRCAA